MSNVKSTRLQPMAIRVTPRQFTLLQELKAFDGISVQDHIRRALDAYLRRVATAPANADGTPTPGLNPPVIPTAELPGRPSKGADKPHRQAPPVFGAPEPVSENPPRVMPKRQQVVYR